MLFEVGRRYRRAHDINGLYGGSRQSGISPSASHPLIFLFTGSSGAQYGYEDAWTDDGVFLFTGEGQTGDMEFVRGNRAIRDHVVDGKDLHLFEAEGHGQPCRYMGQFACSGWHEGTGPDRNGEERKTIIFHLVPFGDIGDALPASIGNEDDDQARDQTLPELRRRALEASNEVSNEALGEGRRNLYQRSADVRRYVLARANGRCEACGADAPFERRNGAPYLEPHHIRRLSDGGPDHPRWVAGICPNCHREVHFGKYGEQINTRLVDVIGKIEGDEPPKTTS